MFDNKKVNKFLIISNIIFIISLTTVLITNYNNYKNYKISDKNLTTTKDKLKSNNNKIIELNKQIDTNATDRAVKINEVSNQFLNAFFNYDALTKNKIYDNIKPYSSPSLIYKLQPTKENDLESDVNYTISIKNIRLYSKSIQDNNNVSVLVLADQEMNVNNVDSTTPTLIELKLRNINNNWVVDDLLINTPLKNTPFIN